MIFKKQMKITKFFHRGVRQPEEDYDDLQEEISKLEQTLKEKQDHLFQLQRNNLKCIRAPPKKKSELFVRPQQLLLINSIDSLKREIELMSMLSGVEVQSYVAGEHCSLLFHMQHPAEYDIKHGLMITLKNGTYEVSKTTLPLGFNLPAVLDNFDKIMQPECILSVRKALVAYYDRLDQFDKLKNLLNMEAQLFKKLDGSLIEITFKVRNQNEADPETVGLGVTLKLKYRIYDIRPKRYWFRETDNLPEGTVDNFTLQCDVFKDKPLYQAFKKAFIDGNGMFTMVTQVGTIPVVEHRRRKARHFRAPNPHYNNDDTFHPEDCSESDSDDDIEDH